MPEPDGQRSCDDKVCCVRTSSTWPAEGSPLLRFPERSNRSEHLTQLTHLTLRIASFTDARRPVWTCADCFAQALDFFRCSKEPMGPEARADAEFYEILRL